MNIDRFFREQFSVYCIELFTVANRPTARISVLKEFSEMPLQLLAVAALCLLALANAEPGGPTTERISALQYEVMPMESNEDRVSSKPQQKNTTQRTLYNIFPLHASDGLRNITGEEKQNNTYYNQTVPDQVDSNSITKSELQKLIGDLERNISGLPRENIEVLGAMKVLGLSSQSINQDSDDICIANGTRLTLGMFPLSSKSPGSVRGVYMGRSLALWDVGPQSGGRILVNQAVQEAITNEEVVGIVVEGSTFGRAALVVSKWDSTTVYSMFYESHFAHTRSVDAFLYDAKGGGEGDAVEVFWEPFSLTRGVTKCSVWDSRNAVWDEGQCGQMMYRDSLVGCRCRGAVFVEGTIRRARVIIVEESESQDSLSDEKAFKRVSGFIKNKVKSTEESGLSDVSKLVNKLLSLKPNSFFIPGNDNSNLLTDIGVLVHRAKLPPKERIDLATGKASAVIVDGGDDTLVGVSVVTRWKSDNPLDTESLVTGLHLGGNASLSPSDTEVLVVRLLSSESLPQRISLVISSWTEKRLRTFLFRIVFFTRRVVDLIFSGSKAKSAGVDGVEFVFETACKDWSKVSCTAWDFAKNVWAEDACNVKVISERLHSCICPRAVFQVDDFRRARVLMSEESVNRQSYNEWDEFNRTSHYLRSLTKVANAGEILPNITDSLHRFVLRNLRSNEFVFPTLVLDDLGIILHRLALDRQNGSAFSRHGKGRTNATLFVKEEIVNGSLPTVALEKERGRVLDGTSTNMSDFVVAVSFHTPRVAVDRVAIAFIVTSSRIPVDDRLIHRDKRIVDVSWHQRGSEGSGRFEVDVYLEPFYTGSRPVTVRSKICRLWDFERQDWSGGCTIRVQEHTERCQCTIPLTPNNASIGHARVYIASHWSEQVVIRKSVPFFLLLTSELNLQMVIFHVGCALSLFGLVTVFVTALALKNWRRRLSNKILLLICSALLLQILSVLVYYVAYHTYFFEFFDFLHYHRWWAYCCLAIGVIWSYSYLARWCWMLVMSLLQLLRITTVMGARNVPNLLLKVSVFAWGVPLLTLSYFLADPWANFDEFNSRVYFLTYLLPLFVVLVANLLVFVAILARANACCGWGKMADLKRHGANSWPSLWKRLKSVVVLFFTLEMTWLFELFIYFGYYNGFLHLMSFVVTSFHGFGMFLVFVVLDKEVQAGWRHAFGDWRTTALLYCAVIAGIAVAFIIVLVIAVFLVCLHNLF